MLGQLADVICDTSFLIHLATRRIKNLDSLDVEIGQITFVVPQVVQEELLRLEKNPEKEKSARAALDRIGGFATIPLSGPSADGAIAKYAGERGAIVATMDKELKKRIKAAGGSVLSLSNNRIVLEQ